MVEFPLWIVLLALAGREREAARTLRAAVRYTRSGPENGCPHWNGSHRIGRAVSRACWPQRALYLAKPRGTTSLRLCRERGNVARDNDLKSPLAVTGAKDRGRGNQEQTSRADSAR